MAEQNRKIAFICSKGFSDPVLFNNIFWDNRAGTKTPQGISGIGLPGDPNAIFYWDLGVADGSGVLDPVYSLLHVPYDNNSPTNLIGLDLDDPDEHKTIRLLAQMREWIEGPKLIGVSARPGPELLSRFPMDGYFHGGGPAFAGRVHPPGVAVLCQGD